ncbi:hypothetical protein H6F46_11915 [Limnothrix sp. FACHB-1083]|uniref:hypothetical protein n=1 Tax=unclassified Limnothrix TaxID=2632864 RepID=UPI0016812F80|nr:MULTISPECIES: hypothetical protein [unclassified Limnothrix]MBD2161396.1 hypothetical protein [Limnothrix sp. FACHB-1083]MBD2192092.1 hypothetical protein [Limnothrix sp. FACHB-1088]
MNLKQLLESAEIPHVFDGNVAVCGKAKIVGVGCVKASSLKWCREILVKAVDNENPERVVVSVDGGVDYPKGEGFTISPALTRPDDISFVEKLCLAVGRVSQIADWPVIDPLPSFAELMERLGYEIRYGSAHVSSSISILGDERPRYVVVSLSIPKGTVERTISTRDPDFTNVVKSQVKFLKSIEARVKASCSDPS